MRLIDELRDEHVLIETVAGSLLTFVGMRLRGEAGPADGAAFLRFFRDFSGSFHHGREEDTLFPALVKEVELPSRRGPVSALVTQHHEMTGTLLKMAPLLSGDLTPPGAAETLEALARTYVHTLWRHIDAENSVVLPESESRLVRAGVPELPVRPMTEAEARARAEGERLSVHYPPEADADAIRGEGCVICPSYGVTCEGLEREWWSEWEWEAFADRQG